VCEIEVKSLEANLGIGSSPLRIQDIKFTTGPQLGQANSRDSRSFTCYDQHPHKLDATVSGMSYSRGNSGRLSVGYPPSVGVTTTKNWTETIQRPSTCLGLNLKDMEIGIDCNNQFVSGWRYPILRKNDLRHKLVKFENHNGSMAYVTSQFPESIRTTASMTYDINVTRFSWAFNHLRGLIPSRTKVKDGNQMYPCRQVRFKLPVDVFPDDAGEFWFPGEDECGSSLDMGEYCFKKDPNGVLVLEIQRKNGVPHYILQPQIPPTSTAEDAETGTVNLGHSESIEFQAGTGKETSPRSLESSVNFAFRKSWPGFKKMKKFIPVFK
jgi:hypothetical protein